MMHGPINIRRKEDTAESTRVSNKIAIEMSRIEVGNEFVVALKRVELRDVYVRSNECWGSAEVGIFTIFSE